MSIVYNSTETAKVINRAIDNSMGTTTTSQGADADGLIISEDLQNIVQCTGGYTNPFVVKSITGVPPVEFHAVERQLKSWNIKGNTDNGDNVGELSDNLFDKSNANIYNNTQIITEPSQWRLYDGTGKTIRIAVSPSTNYALAIDQSIETSVFRVFAASTSDVPIVNVPVTGTTLIASSDDNTATFTTAADTLYIVVQFGAAVFDDCINTLMLCTGTTPKPYEPFGIVIPIELNSVTYNAYISDYLRKSTGDAPVYDIMYSDGTITRNVDSDGTPLVEPTTETYTPVALSTIWGYNTFDVDTTVTPSSVTIEYYDN